MYRNDKQFMSNPNTANCRVYVGGIPKTVVAADLDQKFNTYGKILGLVLQQGFAFVQFENEQQAQAAIQGEAAAMLHGRKIQVKQAMGKRDNNQQQNNQNRRQGPNQQQNQHQVPPQMAPPARNEPPNMPADEPNPNQGPSNPPMGPKGAINPPMGPKGPNSAPMGPKGPNSAPMGPKGPNSAPMGLKGPNNFPMGPKGPNNGPMGPRGPPPMNNRPGGKNMNNPPSLMNMPPVGPNMNDFGGDNNRGRKRRKNRFNNDFNEGFYDYQETNHPQGPPRGPDQGPLPPISGKIGQPDRNDCEIIVVSKLLTKYAEYIEQRLKSLGLIVDLLFPNEDVPIGRVLANISSRGCLYAILVMPQNEEHKSLTLNVLHNSPQEHRNMPIEDALIFITRNFDNYMRGDKTSDSPNGVTKVTDRHPTAMQLLVNLLAENRQVTTAQYDRLLRYLGERREIQLQHEVQEGVNSEPAEANSKQVELQSRIMNILNKTATPEPAEPAEPKEAPPLLKDPTVQKALDSLLVGEMFKNIGVAL